MNIKKLVFDKINSVGRNPFLFVGAGLTKRYLNTENWEELLRKFAREFSSDDFRYDIYKNQVDEADYYGKQPQIASLLEKDYNNAVLTEDSYKAFRERHKNLIQSDVSSLKIAISEYLNTLDYNIINSEINLLKKLSKRNISGIITTNYDLLLETIFQDFEVFIGQDELIFSDIYQIGEIYKIHGSITEPKSLVLTSEDYKVFESSEHYLIAKILTIFLEYPIVFLGYSIKDRNILNILKSITFSLSQEKLDLLKDRFIFIEYSTDKEEISQHSQSFENGKTISMLKITTNNFMDIFEAIQEQKALYSPKVLRQLREDIYNLAVDYTKTSKTNANKIVATELQNLDKLPEYKKIILGVGVFTDRGYRSIRAREIYEDIVFDNKYFDAKNLIEISLPELLKSNSGGLPLFKYLKKYNGEIYERVKTYAKTHCDMDSFLNSSLRKTKPRYRDALDIKSLHEIISIEGFDNAYRKMCFLEDKEIDIMELESYLKKLMETNPNAIEGNTELKRLIRIYDFLKYTK